MIRPDFSFSFVAMVQLPEPQLRYFRSQIGSQPGREVNESLLPDGAFVYPGHLKIGPLQSPDLAMVQNH